MLKNLGVLAGGVHQRDTDVRHREVFALGYLLVEGVVVVKVFGLSEFQHAPDAHQCFGVLGIAQYAGGEELDGAFLLRGLVLRHRASRHTPNVRCVREVGPVEEPHAAFKGIAGNRVFALLVVILFRHEERVLSPSPVFRFEELDRHAEAGAVHLLQSQDGAA